LGNEKIPKAFTNEALIKTRGDLLGFIASHERMIAQIEMDINNWDNELGRPPDRYYEQKWQEEQSLYDCKREVGKIDGYLQLSPAERVEAHYQQLIDTKNITRNYEKFKEIAEKFRRLEGYKDAETLAAECVRLYNLKEEKNKYDELLSRKSKATSAKDFRAIGKAFGGLYFADSNELANDCEKQAQIIDERVYSQAIKDFSALEIEENNVSTSSGYERIYEKYVALYADFNSVLSYKEAKNYASKCAEKEKEYENKFYEKTKEELYDHKVKEFQMLDSKGGNTISDFEKIADKYEDLAAYFRSVNYKDSHNYAVKCENIAATNRESIQKIRAEEENRINRKRKMRFTIGTLLQLSMLGCGLYLLFWTSAWYSDTLLLLFSFALIIGLLDIIIVRDEKKNRIGYGFWCVIVTWVACFIFSGHSFDMTDIMVMVIFIFPLLLLSLSRR